MTAFLVIAVLVAQLLAAIHTMRQPPPTISAGSSYLILIITVLTFLVVYFYRHMQHDEHD